MSEHLASCRSHDGVSSCDCRTLRNLVDPAEVARNPVSGLGSSVDISPSGPMDRNPASGDSRTGRRAVSDWGLPEVPVEARATPLAGAQVRLVPTHASGAFRIREAGSPGDRGPGVARSLRSRDETVVMAERDAHESRPDDREHALKFFDIVWSVVGNELPGEVHDRVLGPLDRLGNPREQQEETIRRVQRTMDVYEGLLAAQYHRDNIKRIEVELVRTLREEYPEGSVLEGGGASARMPVVAHEYVAYLFAARRTLDYLAQAVSAFFGRRVFSIKDLAGDLVHGKPKNLAAEAAAISDDVVARSPNF